MVEMQNKNNASLQIRGYVLIHVEEKTRPIIAIGLMQTYRLLLEYHLIFGFISDVSFQLHVDPAQNIN